MASALWGPIRRWLKDFSWLWGIRQTWDGVKVVARQAPSTPEELLKELTRGDVWLYLYGEQIGPRLEDILEYGDMNDVEKRTKALIKLCSYRHWLQNIAIVHESRQILILRPPPKGWAYLIFELTVAETEPKGVR